MKWTEQGENGRTMHLPTNSEGLHCLGRLFSLSHGRLARRGLFVRVQSFTPRRGVSRLRRRSTIRSACKAGWYPGGVARSEFQKCWLGTFSEMLVGDQQFSATNFRSTILSHKLLSVKAERSDGESELIHKRCAHLRSPLPGERPGYFRCRSQMYANEGDGCIRRTQLLVNIELIHKRCAHLRSPLPGIWESDGQD